jgi:hypothetical protein
MYLEAESGLSGSGQCGEDLCWGRRDAAAFLAHEVTVSQSGQMVGAWTVSQVGVQHDSESFKLVEVAIHSRHVDAGPLGVNLRGELLGRAIPGRIE